MRDVFAILVAATILTGAVDAQWLKYPTPSIPRTKDGKPDLNAPAPKFPNGSVDPSGLWYPAAGYIRDLAKDIKVENVPLQPWAEKVYRQRLATSGRDDPGARCIPGGLVRLSTVPYPFRIAVTPDRVLVLYEAWQAWREILTDGRPLPRDPQPTWRGYSVGKWEGDAFVVQSAGFNNEGWLDNNGLPATDRLSVTEKFRRRNFGQMNLEIVIDDPGAYTRPWSVTIPLTYQADTEMLEYVCAENNKYFDLVPKESIGKE
jgi:hypothetical protein